MRVRSFEFAVRVVKLCRFLHDGGGIARTLGVQLLRSGVSIGANLEEAQAGQSRADFISKNSIALKEARETSYWLRLLAAASVLPEQQIRELRREAEEITRIIGAIIVSAKRNSRTRA